MPPPYTSDPGGGGIRLSVRITPKSSRDGITGLYTSSDGTTALAVRVRAQPEKGKANAAVIRVVAKTLGVPRSDVELVAGATNRNKTLTILGETSVLTRRVDSLIDAGE